MTTTTCNVCTRDAARMNSPVAECSHIQFPHRRSAWSERPTPAELFKGPWPKRTDADPMPADTAMAIGRTS